MISGIQQGTDQAVSSMRQRNTRARSTLDIAKSAGTALEADRNLMNIRDLAQQTSAGANQTSAASQELSRLAVDLNTMVARFSV